jgi:ferredoxin
MSSPRTHKTARVVRLTALVIVLGLSTALGLLHSSESHIFVPVSVCALCPFGGIETLWSYLATGAILQRIAFSSLVLLGSTVVVALIAGRAFCGQVCPLGTLQELVGRIGRRFGWTRTNPPAPIDRVARLLKYVVLVVATAATWWLGTLVFRPYDPWAAYHHVTSTELFTEFGIGGAILGVSLAGSLIYQRFFCRYACPMGAGLALLAPLSWFKVRRTEASCTDCRQCSTICPVGIDVSGASTVDSTECISCGECVTACTVPNTLAIADRTGRTLPPLVLTIFTLAVFFGVVGIATAVDSFDWTIPTLAGEVQRAQEGGAPVDTSVIKGSMSMNQTADATGIPATELQQVFGLPDDAMDLALGCGFRSKPNTIPVQVEHHNAASRTR